MSLPFSQICQSMPLSAFAWQMDFVALCAIQLALPKCSFCTLETIRYHFLYFELYWKKRSIVVNYILILFGLTLIVVKNKTGVNSYIVPYLLQRLQYAFQPLPAFARRSNAQALLWRVNTKHLGTNWHHIQVWILLQEQTTLQACMDSQYLWLRSK